jgi:predicted ArsR family transcriptional regulator
MFEWIEAQESAVGVTDLEARFGLNHTTVRQHIARLVDAGLLIEDTAPPTGPGRPRLVYRVAPGVEGTWHHDGPYERLGLLLLEMLQTGSSARDVGAAAGRRLATSHPGGVDATTTIEECMAEQGFAPRRRERARGAELVMTQCPFPEAAQAAPEVVCDLHRGLAEGLADALGGVTVADLVARPPRRAGCRLELDAALETRGEASPTAVRHRARDRSRRRSD